MKKLLIIILVSFIWFLQINECKTETIKPTVLTAKQTANFQAVNNLVQKTFNNIKLKINTDSFPATVSALKSPPEYDATSTFYYIKKDGLNKYTYDKDTGALKYIDVYQDNGESYPKVLGVYSYPEGSLLNVVVQISPKEQFHFNANGEYIDFKSYMSCLQSTIKYHWSPKLRPAFPARRFNSSLKTTVNFKINKKGELLAYKINRYSGNFDFDSLSVETLKEAFPVGELPAAFNLDSIEIQFTFAYNVIGQKNAHNLKNYDLIRQKKIFLPRAKLEYLKEQYQKISNDKLIWLALDLLKESKHAFIIESLLHKNKSKKPIEIYFCDLSSYVFSPIFFWYGFNLNKELSFS